MNLKALITTAMLVVGTSSAAFAAPRVEVVRDHAPVAVRVEEHHVVRPIGRLPYGHGPVVIGRRSVEIRPVWHPIIRPIARPVFVGAYVNSDALSTIGSFDVAFDGTQTIDLGAGRVIDTLRVAGDANTEIYGITVTYADGQTQTIACNQCGSFETDLGGNLVTKLSINADHASTTPLQVEA